jgi:hypothetical protein
MSLIFGLLRTARSSPSMILKNTSVLSITPVKNWVRWPRVPLKINRQAGSRSSSEHRFAKYPWEGRPWLRSCRLFVFVTALPRGKPFQTDRRSNNTAAVTRAIFMLAFSHRVKTRTETDLGLRPGARSENRVDCVFGEIDSASVLSRAETVGLADRL